MNQANVNDNKSKLTILATTSVWASSSKSMQHKARVLIDPGSEISFITEELAARLKVKRKQSSINIISIGNSTEQSTRGMTTVTLQSRWPYNPRIECKVYILRKLTAKIPPFTCVSNATKEMQKNQLADPTFWKTGNIDIILGANHYRDVIQEGIQTSKEHRLIAQKTIFGWAVWGPTCCDDCFPRTSLSTLKKSTNQELIELLRSFWIQEEISSKSTMTLTPEERECEEHFQKTHYRDSTGRYVVRLPFKSSPKSMGDSRQTATNFLKKLQRRLSTPSSFSDSYREFLKEYQELGHMIEAPTEESTPAYYLPHHGVSRADSQTTKLRVVFNGSAKSSTGVSLNDILHAGPKLQINSADVLLWFRMYRLVFGTDIAKMFRQIEMDPEDWDFQRILWFNEQRKITEYQLTTVTYGTTCAPWLALRVLKQLSEDEGHKYPKASRTLDRERYVDDIFGGADTEKDLETLIIEMTSLCRAGGFPLQKWCSNSTKVIEKLNLAASSTASSALWNDSPTKVLDIKWQPQADILQFTTGKIQHRNVTKRGILSEIAQIYDPLGLISPVIVKAKILMQQLWLIKAGWDDELPTKVVQQWNIFREELKQLETIKIPRWLQLSSNILNVQIHGFADASNDAMGAVIYLRVQSSNHQINVTLACSKTKVSPLKRMTISRLELTAAVIVTELATYVQRTLELTNVDTHLWTDSSVALTWIRGHPSRWKEFISNRVQKIQETQPNAVWNHINGKENPADCASHGITPDQLKDHQLWWAGPSWLNQPQQQWPTSIIDVDQQAAIEEKPTPVQSYPVQVRAWDEFLERYSSSTKMLRVTATLHRAIRKFKRLPVEESPVITPEEIDDARKFWLTYTQRIAFDREVQRLRHGNNLPPGHPLANLTPILDNKGLLRVGGRLNNAAISEDEQHQPIIPRESPLTTLIVQDAHQRTHHGGTQLTLAQIRQRYWIIGGRAPVRSHILKCVICARWRQVRAQQLMGQLPSERTTANRAFEHTGVDFAGPLQVLRYRAPGVSTNKCYIAVFICMVTSAIHLELVTKYTTEAFIAAYKRFTSRRGLCKTLHSDHGSNFLGADIQLKEMFNESSRQLKLIADVIASHGTEWKFIPPRAPHFGGKWEAAVKSVKHHLRRIIGGAFLTYEEFTTILCQVEAVVNSRPLCPLTNDPDDCSALTPGHFLVGHPLTSIPEPSLLHEKAERLNGWRTISFRLQQFWDRWHRECIQRYQAIYKWNRPSENLKQGTLVLIIDENYPPSNWPLARVVVPHVARDGHVRVVRCKTANGRIVIRPIHKLVPLPLNVEEDFATPEGINQDPQQELDDER